MRTDLLSGLVVTEFGGTTAAARFCGKALADLGATVYEAEPVPAGFPVGQSLYLEFGKHGGVAGDLPDAVIIGAAYGRPRDASDVPMVAPVTTIFRAYGDERDVTSPEPDDLVLFAQCGLMNLIGDPEREPLKNAGDQPNAVAGLYGAVALLAGVYRHRHTGRESGVLVPTLDCMTSAQDIVTARYEYTRNHWPRQGGRRPQNHPMSNLPCKDGYVAATVVGSDDWRSAATLMECEWVLDDPRFATPQLRARHADELDAAFAPWLMAHTASEIVELAQAWRIPFGAVLDPAGLLASEQLRRRRFFAPAESGEREVLLPTAPGVVTKGEFSGPAPRRPTPIGRTQLPLAGVRVIDLSMVWAGPLTARLLAQLGADVIKIEGPRRLDSFRGPLSDGPGEYPGNDPGPDRWNRNARFNQTNLTKRSLVLDLGAEPGREVLRTLLREADILIENYSPRVMVNWGFTWDEVQRINPRLIYLQMPAFGASGPERDYIAYGTAAEAMAGLCSYIGYPGEAPLNSTLAYGDPIGGATGACMAIAALLHRDRTGSGVHIDLALRDAAAWTIGDLIAEAQIDPGSVVRNGNRSRHSAPRGAYRVQGSDRWVALSVRSDEQWRALCEVLGGVFDGLKPLSTLARLDRHEEIDALLRARLAGESAATATSLCMRAGVPAAMVENEADILDDERRQGSGLVRRMDSGSVRGLRHLALPFLFDGERGQCAPAPCFGQHNHEVLRSLGLGEAEIDALLREGVVADRPPV